MKYQEGQRVQFNVNETLKGTGFIRGQSTVELPVMGAIWIIETECVVGIPDSYPYSCIAVQESLISDSEGFDDS